MSAVTDLLQSVKIKANLLADKRVSGLDVSVDVDNGVAHLTGTVETEEDKIAAEEIAAGVDGVVEVENEIVVQSSEELTEDLEDRALADMPTGIPGMVGPAAAPPAYGGPAPGMLTVLPPDDTRLRTGDAVADRVRDAISSDSRVSSTNINIRGEGGIVYLHGSVGSLTERKRVEKTAASVPGVRNVVSELEVRKNR